MPSLTLPATEPASAGRLRDVLGSEWVKFRSLPTARRLTATAVILGNRGRDRAHPQFSRHPGHRSRRRRSGRCPLGQRARA
ncbi:hypothetical protein IOD13_18585 [Brevibacterium casei]|nr:hypothetical protein [Brevibacterium casei]